MIALHELNRASFTHVTIDSNPGFGYNAAPNTDGFNINGRDIYIGQSSVRNGVLLSLLFCAVFIPFSLVLYCFHCCFQAMTACQSVQTRPI